MRPLFPWWHSTCQRARQRAPGICSHCSVSVLPEELFSLRLFWETASRAVSVFSAMHGSTIYTRSCASVCGISHTSCGKVDQGEIFDAAYRESVVEVDSCSALQRDECAQSILRLPFFVVAISDPEVDFLSCFPAWMEECARLMLQLPARFHLESGHYFSALCLAGTCWCLCRLRNTAHWFFREVTSGACRQSPVCDRVA